MTIALRFRCDTRSCARQSVQKAVDRGVSFMALRDHTASRRRAGRVLATGGNTPMSGAEPHVSGLTFR
jgi:hypothetical protein